MNNKYAYGADLGWLSQFEANGIRWVNKDMQEIDPIEELARFGVDAVRLRVFVDPPKSAYWQKNESTLCMLGYCDAQSVLAAAKRAHAAGMRLMIGFHYSDHFADPEIQDIPEAWKNYTDEELHRAVHDHTVSVLELLRENGIEPEWVQVGNEINHGIMWPRAGLTEAPEFLISLFNTGYDAVKEVFPKCKVVAHLACLNDEAECEPFWDAFAANGGRADLFGYSFYPYWFDTRYDIPFIYGQMAAFCEKTGKPMLIVEVGGREEDPDQTCEIVKNTIEAGRLMPEGAVQGIFYWEPCAGADFLPDHYPLGASRTVEENTLQFTKVMETYRDIRCWCEEKA